ncbi:MAG: UDP-N-acetyl-D-glucosamine 6-dehydrogenase [Candidatus Omnitrophica bacterium]|nr:UDP-N-acetyl-D-glucosamine 6-dehydrogenase [Candidatus Omnitrophota bacterium]
MIKKIAEKFRSRRASVAVIGLGYVGLPLATAFARSGFRVRGIDLDRSKIGRLRRGDSYVLDVPSDDIKDLVRSGALSVSTDYASVAACDGIVICVPTPLGKTKEPDLSYILKATERIAGHLKKGQLIVLESTTYPGTTEEVMLPVLQRGGLKVERDFYLAFSPERVDPGNKVYDVASIPKVVGGVGPRSLEAAAAFYGQVMKTVVPVSSARTAEMVKLLENTFRAVNIGLINEVAMMCHRLGLDVWEVIDAAKTKPFGYMPFYPGPGIGGHCLPIDPLYLSWKSRLHGFEAKMIELASGINAAMPGHVVERVAAMLNRRRRPLKSAHVLVLGVSYKRDVDDLRESPALDVVQHLLDAGVRVGFHDPHVRTLEVSGVRLLSQRLTPQLLRRQDCVVVLTDHAAVDYGQVVRYAPLVLDTRNALRAYRGRANVSFL